MGEKLVSTEGAGSTRTALIIRAWWTERYFSVKLGKDLYSQSEGGSCVGMLQGCVEHEVCSEDMTEENTCSQVVVYGTAKTEKNSFYDFFLKQHAENLRDRCKVTGRGAPICERFVRMQSCRAIGFPHDFGGVMTLSTAGIAYCRALRAW